MIVTIGTNDTLASPGAQLDYYKSLMDTMGAARVDEFARLFVIPQANHGLTGRTYSVDAEGRSVPTSPIPKLVRQDRNAPGLGGTGDRACQVTSCDR